MSDAALPFDGGPTTCVGMDLPASGSIEIRGRIQISMAPMDSTWPRPLAAAQCPAGGFSTIGTDVGFDELVFCNRSGEGTFDLEMISDDSNGRGHTDPYLIIYRGAMIPADTLQCLEGDDDGGPGSDSLVSGLALPADAVVTVVPTSFDNMDEGDYILRITRN